MATAIPFRCPVVLRRVLAVLLTLGLLACRPLAALGQGRLVLLATLQRRRAFQTLTDWAVSWRLFQRRLLVRQHSLQAWFRAGQ